jgi:ferritin-like metal-binding protein YciE
LSPGALQMHGSLQHPALPKMAEAARYDELRKLFEIHLAETEAQIERLNECFELLGKTPRARWQMHCAGTSAASSGYPAYLLVPSTLAWG